MRGLDRRGQGGRGLGRGLDGAGVNRAPVAGAPRHAWQLRAARLPGRRAARTSPASRCRKAPGHFLRTLSIVPASITENDDFVADVAGPGSVSKMSRVRPELSMTQAYSPCMIMAPAGR